MMLPIFHLLLEKTDLACPSVEGLLSSFGYQKDFFVEVLPQPSVAASAGSGERALSPIAWQGAVRRGETRRFHDEHISRQIIGKSKAMLGCMPDDSGSKRQRCGENYVCSL